MKGPSGNAAEPRVHAQRALAAAEEAVRASEERFRALAEAAPIAIFLTRATGECIYINATWTAISGLSTEASLHDGWLEATHPEDRDRVKQYWSATAARGEKCELDYRVLKPTGDLRWVHVLATPQFDEAGSVVAYVGSVEDITDRKRAEDALRRSEASLEAAQAQARVGSWELDRGAERKRWSRQMYRLFDRDPARGPPTFAEFIELVHPDDRPRILDAHSRFEAGSSAIEIEFRSNPSLVPARHFVGRVDYVHDGTEPPRTVAGTLLDITERKRAEEERLRLEAQLRHAQKMEALGTLAGGIAHDFNNILMAISGNAQVALADLPSASPVRAALADIESAAARAASLVRRIVTFSRQADSQRRPLALGPVVEEALALLLATLPAMIDIRQELAPGLPGVLADATQIHQVIVNLGANAAHAIGDRSGVLEVRLELVTLTAEVAQALKLPAAQYLRLSVSDDGCGMDQATLQRIFDPFFTTKARGKGTGLGLSAVHGIMRRHGGAVAVDSAPGKGTTFHLYFPSLADASADRHAQASPGALHARGEHVLYVDDEPALVSLADRVLKRCGYRVSGYHDAGAALAAFRARPREFDVVVTDLAMPQMSGRDLAREMLRIRPEVSIVLMSGCLRPEDVVAAKDLGIREVIQKPAPIGQLIAILDQLLRGPGKDRAGP